MSNQKDDIANKETAKILRRAKEVIIQDEQIAEWQEDGHGKAIQHSVHGRMLSRLKASEKTVVLDKMVPTTQLCRHCGHLQKMPQEVRTHECEHCGVSEDRDFASSMNMIFVRNNFDNVIVGPDGPSFNRADFDKRLAELFDRCS